MVNLNNDTTRIESKTAEEEINIREILLYYLRYWKWFVLSLFITVGAAQIYLRYASREYNTTARVLLTDKNSGSPELDALKGILTEIQSNPEVSDQIEVIKSRRILAKVVEKHNLTQSYFTEGKIKSFEIFEPESPVLIVFDDKTVQNNDNFNGSLLLKREGDKIRVLEPDFVPKGVYTAGQNIETRFGNVKFLVQSSQFEEFNIRLNIRPVNRVIDRLRASLMVVPMGKDKNTKAIEISLVGENSKKAEAVINSIIKTYDQDTKFDSKKVANATVDFIEERLKIVTGDLSDVDQDLKQYKTSNSTNNPEVEAGQYFSESLTANKEALSVATQLEVAGHLEQSLATGSNELLPTNIGISDGGLNASINAYNSLMLERQANSKSLRPDNPLMVNLSKSINDVKASIKESLELYKDNLRTKLGSIESQRSGANSQLQQFPERESGLRKIARQQQIVESVYLFLLQKREEAEIRGAATVDAVKVIDWAYTPAGPVSPKTNIIYLGSFMLGLLIPFGTLYLISFFDNKIKTKQDIKEIYSGPYLGEIPESDKILLNHNDHSNLAEAFRILRGNLKFILPKRQDGNTVLITSTLLGEGKTFTALNLAQILALSSNRVLLLGADIRSPKLLKYLDLKKKYKNSKGLTNILSGDETDYRNVVLNKLGESEFDMIHSGPIPPNPAELLLTENWKKLIAELRKDYEFVVIDSAPYGVVADTANIADSADVTLFVVRANYLDKKMIEIPIEAFNNNLLKNMAIILNGTEQNPRYGYGYKYGYGNHDKKKKKLFQSLLKK